MKYLHLISKSKIKKRSDILLVMPTYNAYKVTNETIKKINHQSDISFDILLVDGDSVDWINLIKEHPYINYVVLNKNYGSSGAQRIGAEIAIKYKYKYAIFTDNDALLLKDNALSNMKRELDHDNSLSAVIPMNIEDRIRNKKNTYVNASPFHYIFTKVATFKDIELHNFYLFLYSDDSSFSSKLRSKGKILVCHSAPYYHYVFSPKSIENIYSFYNLRGILIVIFKESNIPLISRLNYLLFFFYKLIQLFVNSMVFLDFSYIVTIWYIFVGACNLNRNLLAKIPKNKYIMRQVNYVGLIRKMKCVDLADRLNLFIPPRLGRIYSNYYKRYYYYALIKNE